jgi:ParB-like chromosome segregation protein Spo0J
MGNSPFIRRTEFSMWPTARGSLGRSRPSRTGSDVPKETPSGAVSDPRPLVKVDISAITMKASEFDARVVAELAESFRLIGQICPIIAYRQIDGVAVLSGNHRIEAARILGWEQVDALILDGDADFRTLIQLSENLHRRALSVLDKSEHLAAWIEIVGRKAAQLAQPAGGAQPANRYLSKTAREMNITREEVRRAERVASLTPEAKSVAKKLALVDNQRALLAAAKTEGAHRQSEVLQAFADKKAAPRRAPTLKAGALTDPASCEPPVSPEQGDGLTIPASLDRRDPGKELERLAKRWAEFHLALEAAPENVQRRFIVEFLLTDPTVIRARSNAPTA